MVQQTTTNATDTWHLVNYNNKNCNKKSHNLNNIKTKNIKTTSATAITIKKQSVQVKVKTNSKNNTVTSAANTEIERASVQQRNHQKPKENKSTIINDKLNVGQQQHKILAKTKASTVAIKTTAIAQVANLNIPLKLQQQQQKLIKQIKRAHRHLLTSGGNDKQQQPQQTQSQSSGLTTVRAVKNSTTVNFCGDCQRHVSCCSCIFPIISGNDKINKKQQKKGVLQQSSSSQLGCEGNKNAKNKKNQKYKRTTNNNNRNHNIKQNIKGVLNKNLQQQSDNLNLYNNNSNKIPAYAESVISSRWCSIEEQLDNLDKLLYYCDDNEEDEYFLNTSWSNLSSIENDNDNQDKEEQFYIAYNSTITDNVGVEEFNWYDMSVIPQNDNNDADSTISSGSNSTATIPSSLVPTSLKRRGHQHHPRFSGTRRPIVPPNVQQILDAIYRSENTTSNDDNDDDNNNNNDEDDFIQLGNNEISTSKSALNLPLSDSITNSLGSSSPTPTDDSSMLDEGVISAQTPTASTSTTSSEIKIKKKKKKNQELHDDKQENRKKRTKKTKAANNGSAYDIATDATDKNCTIDEGIGVDEDDMQSAEWANLRCTSEAAEVVAEREARRNKGRCADYPGLAFGRSIFSSDTMMKFNIIRNELHNIMKTQLKRVNTQSHSHTHVVVHISVSDVCQNKNFYFLILL